MTSFTPNPNFDKENSNPKDWAYHLGAYRSFHRHNTLRRAAQRTTDH